ncbi:MAG: transporter ATP-binding protein [Bacteroidetes bacterium]|nr:transporter ATP-binding protein [Bacteroidota bacterium]
MSDTIIKVEGLGKQYRLGQIGTGALSHDINRAWHLLRGKEDPYLKVGEVNDRTMKGGSDLVWALKDINFDVKRGEAIGIIGKNGAGKSTLLKILSQITSPTVGEIKVKGRIAALLEVGTGFHPELTGRENIFLNGAILGMTKAEIRRKLDEIIAFSGVEKYVDTPAKRYSSGMMVRLGFAVAAHLEPEILIVDEVLAVGDAEFQKKAIGKMKEVSEAGERTVLFVSHNMASVKSLCSKGIVLSNGSISFSGGVDESVNAYLKDGNDEGMTEYKVLSDDRSAVSAEVEVVSVGIKAHGKEYGDSMRMDEELELTVTYNKKKKGFRLDSTIQVKDNSGNYLFVCTTASADAETNENAEGLMENKLLLPKNFFNADTFYINLLMVIDERAVAVKLNDVLSFTIMNKQLKIGAWMGKGVAPLKPDFKWEITKK